MAGKEKLSTTGVKALKAIGRHSDGGGLYLRIQAGGRKSWIFTWKRQGVQRDLGLGSFKDVSLANARRKAAKARDALAEGKDPRDVLRPPPEKTFLDTAKACLAARKLDQMSPKTKRKWERTAYEFAKPLHSRAVGSVTREDVLNVLEPIWERTPETGRIVRAQLEIIFDYAKGRYWSKSENPAKWKGGLETVLTLPSRKDVKHHAAMPYSQIPAFMDRLRERDAISARALEFTILTMTRTSETLDAVWSEFDMERRLWTIPSARMQKTKEAHQIPLTERALHILKKQNEMRLSEYVFPGQRTNRPLSNMSMLNLLKRMREDEITVHGFRSTARDYIGNETNHEREIAEQALSHQIGNEVERSYRRGRALDKHRRLLEDWERYCLGGGKSDVVRIYG